MPPEPGSFASQARTTARHGEVLAGPAGGEDSSAWNKPNCSEVIAGHFRHVIELVGVGEVPTADSCCGLVDFDSGDRSDPGPRER